MSYVPAIVRRCPKGSIQAYPTYYCNKEDLIAELGVSEESLMKDLNSGRDMTGMEQRKCMHPIIPKCLAMINMKSKAGRVQAASVLLEEEKYERIPNEILMRDHKLRFDPQRFREYSKFMDSNNRDFVFGEIFGAPNNWAFNCYVKVPIEGVEMDMELPVMMLYNNPNVRVGLWYIGEENGKLLFMHSTNNVPSITTQISGNAGKGLKVHVSGLGSKQRIHRVK